MNKINICLRTLLCFLMVLMCSMLPLTGFAIRAEAAKPAYGPGAYAEEEKLYFNGGELRLLQSMNDGTILSCLIRTKGGELIVVDGGRENESDYLVTKIRELGGRVSLWLVTHPHDDHVGALTKLLRMEKLPVDIDRIAWNFLAPEDYIHGEHMDRVEDMNAFLDALSRYPDEGKITGMTAMQQIECGDALITVLNEPMYFDKATFNNSSILYRIEMDGRRILITGDMGALEADYLMRNTDSSIFRADILQVAHHGNGRDSASLDFYRAVSPTVCLWPSPSWIWNNEEYDNPALRNELTGIGTKLHLSCSSGDKILR